MNDVKLPIWAARAAMESLPEDSSAAAWLQEAIDEARLTRVTPRMTGLAGRRCEVDSEHMDGLVDGVVVSDHIYDSRLEVLTWNVDEPGGTAIYSVPPSAVHLHPTAADLVREVTSRWRADHAQLSATGTADTAVSCLAVAADAIEAVLDAEA